MTQVSNQEKLLHKVCSTCKELKELSAFSIDERYYDGHRGQCIACRNAYYRKKILPKIKDAEYYRKRMRSNQKLYVERHPERAKAHRLARANKEALLKDNCEKCGAKEKLHMHHPDYSKPLEVITLCVSCHEITHHGVNL